MVGAATEAEMKEKKARVEDALHATRAATEEGILPGGGAAYLKARSRLKNLQSSPEERIGIDIIRRALEAPIRQIVENAGVDGSIVVQTVAESTDYNFGFNAATEKYEDLLKSGVIDPTKVTCAALQNAASVATLLLNTDALVSVVSEKKKAGPEMPDMDY
jgi:chaperonin GroEL